VTSFSSASPAVDGAGAASSVTANNAATDPNGTETLFMFPLLGRLELLNDKRKCIVGVKYLNHSSPLGRESWFADPTTWQFLLPSPNWTATGSRGNRDHRALHVNRRSS